MTRKNFAIFQVASVLVLSWISRTCAQSSREDCSKYCFINCENFRADPDTEREGYPPSRIWIPSLGILFYGSKNLQEYTDCQIAHSTCNCGSQFSLRNPVLWTGLVISGIVVLMLLYYLCRRHLLDHIGHLFSRKDSNPEAPQVPPANNYDTFTDWYRGSDYEDSFASSGDPPGYIPPPPPDYIPPPSYDDLFEKTPSPIKDIKDTASSCEPNIKS